MVDFVFFCTFGIIGIVQSVADWTARIVNVVNEIQNRATIQLTPPAQVYTKLFRQPHHGKCHAFDIQAHVCRVSDGTFERMQYFEHMSFSTLATIPFNS